uniref:Uncharacterized protein n=1 Tax=Tanacetum cinerariifolium TaxID=118510 RepID=A0A699H2S6_TANCI|nr:hypothetical protein [Tanacetum cinerariifolium]
MIKKCNNPTSTISDETIANPNAQIVGNDMVRVHVPRCMALLDYGEHVDSLSTMDNEVGVTSPKSTTQTLQSFEEYTSLVTCPKEVEKTSGTPIEVEPFNETKLEEVGLNCNHNTPFSYGKVPSFDGPELQPLLNSPSLDVSLGDIIGPEPPIKPHSPNSSRVKVVDYLTTQTPPLTHVVNSHPKGVYVIITQEMFNDDWGLESKEVSFLGRILNSPVRPNEVKKVRINEAHRLESILQQQISQRMAPSHHDGAATDGYTGFMKALGMDLGIMKSGGRNTQIDYLLVRRGNLRSCKDCQVFLGANQNLGEATRFRELFLCRESHQEDMAMAKELYKVARREAKKEVA